MGEGSDSSSGSAGYLRGGGGGGGVEAEEAQVWVRGSGSRSGSGSAGSGEVRLVFGLKFGSAGSVRHDCMTLALDLPMFKISYFHGFSAMSTHTLADQKATIMMMVLIMVRTALTNMST